MPIEVFDKLRADLTADRSQFYKDLASCFMGPSSQTLKSRRGSWIRFGCGAYECIKQFSETDFTEDLKKFDVATLVLHGEADQIVPVKDSGQKTARIVKDAKDIYYPGASHSMFATHQDKVNADLLAFLKS